MNKVRLGFIILIVQYISGCTFSGHDGVDSFLGLEFGKELSYTATRKEDGPPMLARSLNPYYEIDYPNMEFDTVGVALTEFIPAEAEQGYKFKNKKVIWGAAFLNKKNKNPCTQAEYEKILDSIKKNHELKLVKEHANQTTYSKVRYDYDKWTSFYSKGALWTIICSDTTKAVVVEDYSVLIRESDNDKTRALFKKSLENIESYLSRTL